MKNVAAEKNKGKVTERETERKEDLGLREQREKGIWELRKERKRGIGDRGEGKRIRGLSHIK